MVTLLMISVVLVTTLFSCVSDFRSLRIPNLHSLIILGAFIIAFALDPDSFTVWWYHVGAMVGMFVITYLMFCFNMLGSGDSKLGSVLALWVGFKGLIIFLFYMALMGGVLGVITLVLRKKKWFQNPREGSWIASAQNGLSELPYGIAISFGAWVSLFHTSLVHHQIDELIKIMH